MSTSFASVVSLLFSRSCIRRLTLASIAAGAGGRRWTPGIERYLHCEPAVWAAVVTFQHHTLLVKVVEETAAEILFPVCIVLLTGKSSDRQFTDGWNDAHSFSIILLLIWYYWYPV